MKIDKTHTRRVSCHVTKHGTSAKVALSKRRGKRLPSLREQILLLSFLIVNMFNPDAYTTDDIVYKWITEDVDVEQKRMAQFDYKGGKVSDAIDRFPLTGEMQ